MLNTRSAAAARWPSALKPGRAAGWLAAGMATLLVAACGASSSGSSGSSSGPITIGVSVSLSGDFSSDGLATKQGYETWAAGTAETTGNAGVWAPMSADARTGAIFLPVENGTSDLYGGERHGSNLNSSSLVSLLVSSTATRLSVISRMLTMSPNPRPRMALHPASSNMPISTMTARSRTVTAPISATPIRSLPMV